MCSNFIIPDHQKQSPRYQDSLLQISRVITTPMLLRISLETWNCDAGQVKANCFWSNEAWGARLTFISVAAPSSGSWHCCACCKCNVMGSHNNNNITSNIILSRTSLGRSKSRITYTVKATMASPIGTSFSSDPSERIITFILSGGCVTVFQVSQSAPLPFIMNVSIIISDDYRKTKDIFLNYQEIWARESRERVQDLNYKSCWPIEIKCCAQWFRGLGHKLGPWFKCPQRT